MKRRLGQDGAHTCSVCLTEVLFCHGAAAGVPEELGMMYSDVSACTCVEC